MDEVIDYGGFAARMRDAGSRWEVLRAFQREWGYEPPPGGPVWPRGKEDAHRAGMRRFAAEELGHRDAYDPMAGVDTTLPIPAALDEWWDLPFNSFTHTPRLYHTNPVWPPTMDGHVCVFKTEYQDCNRWGYRAADAGLDDPPVLVGDDDGWLPQSRSISEFLLQLAVERLPAHLGWSIRLTWGDLDDDPGIVERLRAAYPELGFLPWRELAADSVAYGAPDAIVHHARGEDADFPLRIHARGRSALLRAARVLGLDVTAEEIEPPEGGPEDDIGPFALAGGEADGRGRWRVVGIGPALPPRAPAEPPVEPPAEPSEAPSEPFEPSVPFEPRTSAAAGLAGAELATGPAVVAAWSDGLVRLRDERSGAVADLWLGTGITGLELRPDATLMVGAGDRTAALRLDPAALWPRRDLALRLKEVGWASLETLHHPPEEVPDLILGAAAPRAADAESAATALRGTLHAPGETCSAATAAVPFLAELLADPGCRVRRPIAALLAGIACDGDATAAAPALRDLLDHPDREVGIGAAGVLAALPGQTPALRDAYARATDAATAAALVLAIGDLSDDPPLEWLREVLAGAARREVRAAAATALLWRSAGEPPDGLVQVLAAELAASASALHDAVWIFEAGRDDLLDEAVASHPAAQIDLVRLALGEPDPRGAAIARAGAAMRTWRAAPAKLLPALAGCLDDHAEAALTEAALAEIAAAGPAAAGVADSLVPLLDAPAEGVAGRALEALARAGDPRCLPALAEDLRSPRLPYDPERALAGLAGHAADLIPALRGHLPGCAGERLGRVLAGLRPWGAAAAPLVPDLIALAERRRGVPHAALALGAVGEAAAGAVPLLRDLLADGKRVRRNAAWALWRITGDATDALPVLAPTFLPVLPEQAALRLYDLGPAARPAVPQLARLLDTDHSGGAAACVIHRATGDPALLPAVAAAVAPTPAGMLAVRSLADVAEIPAAAAARLAEIAESDRVLAEVDHDTIATDRAYRDLAARALVRVRT